jgi:hypothetical protein
MKTLFISPEVLLILLFQGSIKALSRLYSIREGMKAAHDSKHHLIQHSFSLSLSLSLSPTFNRVVGRLTLQSQLPGVEISRVQHTHL